MALERVGRFFGIVANATRSLARGAGVAAFRFPVAAFSILVIAVLSNLAIENVFVSTESDTVWLVAALYAGASASVVAALFCESRAVGGAGRLTAPVAAAAIVGVPVWYGLNLGIFAPALVVAVTLAVPLAPFIGRGSYVRFWSFAFWTSVGVALAFLSVLLFVLGLSAILEMIRFLFEIGVSTDAYAHIFTTAFALVGPLFALGRIPREFDEELPIAGDDRFVAGVRLLFDWVAAPLALLTALVLHAYAAKIVLTGEVPKNEIGWIVTFFALLVLSLRIAVAPFVEGGAVTTRVFASLFAAMLVVPLALEAFAIWLRVDAEGFTVERYYLALAALAAFIVVASQGADRLRGELRLMAAVPVVLLALSAFGPWGVADTVGRSQMGLVRAALSARPSGTEGGERADSFAASVRSRVYAVDAVEQIDRFLPLLDDSDRERLAMAIGTDVGGAADIVIDALGVERPNIRAASRSFTAGAPAVIDIGGFDRATGLRNVANEPDGARDATPATVPERGGASGTPPPPDLSLSNGFLVMRIGATTDRFELSSVLSALPDAAFSTLPENLAAPVFTLVGDGGRSIRIAIEQLVVSRPETSSASEGSLDPSILSLRLSVFYRQGEW